MKLPIFILDLDYSQLHVKVHVSQIKKFLPIEKKNMLIHKPRLDQEKLKRLSENSPARRSSITRLASNVMGVITGSNSNKNGENNRASIGRSDS